MNAVDALAAILAKYQPVALDPKLHCATFSGKDNNELEFLKLFTHFSYCIVSMPMAIVWLGRINIFRKLSD